MFGAIAILFVLPWLDTSKVKSGNYRPIFKWAYLIFIINFIALGWLGGKPAEGVYVTSARLCTFYYFTYFLVILPLLGKFEQTKPLPASIHEAVTNKK
jgi:ubiquinol-cytochrome c reductase cytochrome b subunit